MATRRVGGRRWLGAAGLVALVAGLLVTAASPASAGGTPAVTIDKVVDQASVGAGAPITYHLTITNTGDTALTGVTVTDPGAPDCEDAVPDLGVGEDHVIDCTYTTVNPDDLGTKSNVAFVTTTEGASDISDIVQTSVVAPAPALTVAKSADQAQVVAGEDIDFEVEVENTGNVPLSGVTVTDTNAPDCSDAIGPLGVGEGAVIECTHTTVDPGDVGTFANTATADSDQTAPVVSNTVNVTVTAPAPSLTVAKAADQTSVLAGQDIDYHVTVTNTGNVALTGVALTDANAPDCAGAIGTIAVGAQSVVDCTYTTEDPGDVGTYSNTATADSDQTAPVVSNQVDVTVVAPNPDFTVVKSADQESVVAGEDIDYHITVTNTGNVTLTGISVGDVDAPDCAGAIPDLAPAAAHTVDCTYTTVSPTDVGTYSNTAVVSTNETGEESSNQVDVTVVAADPEITAEKSADQETVVAGEDIDYTIDLENTGNVTLTGITVTDDAAPDCAGPAPDLEPGETHAVECTYTTVSPTDVGTKANVAAVTTDQTSPTLTNLVATTVEAQAPALTVEKDADQAMVAAGEDIDYHVTVENTGNVTLTGVTITDPNATDCAGPVTDLDPDETVTVDCTYTTAIDDVGTYTNVATADSAQTAPVASEDVDVTVTAPQCNGQDVTVLVSSGDDGTEGADVILGTPGADDIDAGSGADVVCAGGGEDGVTGGFGNDRIFGGLGSDTLYGEGGTDLLFGNNGADLMDGGGGNDRVDGGTANDALVGGPGHDQLEGGPGNEVANAGKGDDVVRGGDGNDAINGQAGDDRLEGNDGNDIVEGAADDDRLFGGANRDVCRGGAGTDTGNQCEVKEQIP